ncbi:MAG: RcpC/CpaB family pilus assembly protein [Eggerthellales bacterium]|nr:RcpC/CpaB family pilus assembly protein [Eggerthellales bacterium]
MKRGNITAMLATGALCAVLMFAFTQSVQGQAAKERSEVLEKYGGEQVEVCVATSAIPAGETPNLGNTAIQLWVSGLLPEDPVTSLSQVSDKTLTTSVVKGEVLSFRHFDQVASSVEVPEGYCAISVPTEDVRAVGGAIGAGMRVDAYLSGSSEISLLAEDVLVLGTSVTEEGNSQAASKMSWVTLAVLPEKVPEFISAADKGSLYFALPGQEPDAADESTDEASDSSAGDGKSSDNGGYSSDASGKSSDKTDGSSDSSSKSSEDGKGGR